MPIVMPMPLPEDDSLGNPKRVVIKYKFTPQEIYVHYYMSSVFRRIIDSNKYVYIDEFLCLKSPECIEIRDGKHHIKNTSPEFLRLYCIGKKFLEQSGTVLQHSRGAWKCIKAIKESSIDTVNDDVFSSIISGGQEPPPGTFGEGVKFYLALMGITQEELAARMGVATETVSRICRDVYEPPINMAIAVCVALNLLPYQTTSLLSRLGYSLDGVSQQMRAYKLIVNVFYEDSVESCNRRLLKHRLKPLTNPKDR